MSDVLSQSEIDALLAQMFENQSEGAGPPFSAVEAKPVKAYDFRTPRKFGQDHIRSLNMIHENFARYVATFLASRTRTQVHVQLSSVAQFTAAEFMQNLSNPTVLAKFKLNPLSGVGILEFSQNVAFAIIERLFGAKENSKNYPIRALTEIETYVMQHILSGMVATLQEAWRPLMDVEPALHEGIETNPMFLQISAPSDVLAVLTFEITLGEHEGHFLLAIPFAMVEPLLPRLSQHRWVAGETSTHPPSEEDRQSLEHMVRETLVPITAELGRLQMTMGEFVRLKPGDTIALSQRTTDPISIYVGDRKTFEGEPGVVHGRMAVQITACYPPKK